MNITNNHRFAMFGRIDTYGTEHPLTPAIPQATALFTELKAVITDINAAIGAQEAGLAAILGAASDIQRITANLRGDMRDITKTAQTLDEEQFPGIRQEFRMPTSEKLAVFTAAAHSFLEKLTATLKPVFVAHGLPADFDEQLQAKVTELDAALARKNAGAIKRKGGTVGMDAKSRRGMDVVRALDAIHRNKLRTFDPVLFAVWNAAKRLESMPVRAKSAQPGPAGSTPPAPPTPAQAPAPAPASVPAP